MAMDILPTGKNMVTRTPLDIRLHKLSKSKEGWIEFGHYSGTDWITDFKLTITVPNPTQSEINQIRKQISIKTVELAGDGMDISPEPIILKIYSPYVPNLSLIDLPGLTMVAQIDRGQPANIKEKIEDMIASYIKQKRTIIIAVMQARNDLETDLGMALIKKYDGSGHRTIGVLTKPDLMNYETHVGEYLTNNISKNLMLTYGYFVVRNRSDKEMETMDIFKGFESEKSYFSSHDEYKRDMYKERVGIGNLSTNLNNVLVTSITEMLPSVMTEIMALETKINRKLERMGDSLPGTKEGQMSLLNKYVSNFYYKFVDSIESRGKTLNTGKEIKDTFVEYREELHAICPFTNDKIYNTNYFMDVVSSFEGNHMSFHIPPIQVLEACMVDDNLRPILNLRDRSMQCTDTVCDILIDLIRSISKQEEFARFPPLATHIISVIIDEIISPVKIRSKQIIGDTIKIEEDYIWTDSEEFKKVLLETTQHSELNDKLIINLLETYFTSVKSVIGHSVPKIIMSNIVRELEKSLLTYLFQNIVVEESLELLREDDGIEKKRNYYSGVKMRIDGIKQIFNKSIKQH
jgi:hypothetical protein